MKFVAAAVALLASSVSAVEYCQRGWFKSAYAAQNMQADYDGSVDFKACTGRKYKSESLEYGRWWSCGTDDNNATDLTTYVWEKYYDSFKCNDGNLLNSTRVGAVGDLSDSGFVDRMASEYGFGFLLFEEDDTFCNALLTVECTIETNTLITDRNMTGMRCSQAEMYREKNQMPTRKCQNGMVYNCTSGDEFDLTLYSNTDCTGSSSTYEFSSGCQAVIQSIIGTTITFDTDNDYDVRILKCTACPPLATAVAAVLALFVALWN